LDYDETEKGFIVLDDRVLRVRWVGGPSEDEDESIDDTIDEFFRLFPVKGKVDRVDVTANSYNGLYKERPNEGIALNPLFASTKCAACESGDCLAHPGSINSLTNSVITPKPPVESVIEDANFFKESEHPVVAARNRQPGCDYPGDYNTTHTVLDTDLDDPYNEYPVSDPRACKLVNPTEAELISNLPEETPMNGWRHPARIPKKRPALEEDEFEVYRTASGRIVVADVGQDEAEGEEQEQLTKEEIAKLKQADTKSYGAGTPLGGTPTAPKPTDVNPAPTAPMPNPVPPVQSQNKTPQQLHDEAQTNPAAAGDLTQQQLQQVLQALKTSARNEIEEFAVQKFAVQKFAEQIRNAAVPIKETPTSLPPRDDLRRHLDETAQAEVMEGVKSPADPAPAPNPAPATPGQANPNNPPDQPPAPTAQQELLKQTLSSVKDGRKISYTWEDDDDEDDGPDGSYGIKASKTAGISPTGEICNYCKEEYSNGTCDYCGDLISNHCDASNSAVQCQDCGKWVGNCCCMTEDQRGNVCNKCYRKDKRYRRGSKIAIQTEEGVNLVCPACHSVEAKKLETSAEEGSLVECIACGCFFAL
jgi:hypothetical protein